MAVTSSAQSLGTESLAEFRAQSMATARENAKKTTVQQKIVHPKGAKSGFLLMTREEADKVIMSEVETILARGEPLVRLLDEFAVSALIAHNPAIGNFLPQDERTIYEKYVVPIDRFVSSELTKIMAQIPGLINVAFDGATINGKQKVIYTVSKGEFSSFHHWSNLGSDIHVTEKEVQDAKAVCDSARSTYNCSIASLPVDNAALNVATKVAALLQLEGEKTIVSRDPAHCVDLLSKDLAKTAVVSGVLKEAKEVYSFCKKDRIDSIRIESMKELLIDVEVCAKHYSETRMNFVHEHVRSAAKQNQFIASLNDNEKFRKFYNERGTKEKNDIDAILGRCNHTRWTRMETLCTLSVHFVRVHHLCSRSDFPLSCYVLLVQALRNSINKAISVDDRKFDRVLGPGSAAEIANMIRERFNMDGKSPSGRKVGLLDSHHIWCFICDPFNFEWREKFKIAGNLRVHVQEMIDHFIPLDEDGTCTTRRKIHNDFEVSFIQCYN